MFDPANMTWILLTAAKGSTKAPSARSLHGFTSAGGKLYVHGGTNDTGLSLTHTPTITLLISLDPDSLSSPALLKLQVSYSLPFTPPPSLRTCESCPCFLLCWSYLFGLRQIRIP